MNFSTKYEYEVKQSSKGRKRVCLAIDLKDNPDVIAKYKHYHKPENNWPEINRGLKEAGILMMDIFLVDNRMFMICEIDEKDSGFGATESWQL